MRLSPSDVIVRDLLEPASTSCRQQLANDGKTSGKVFFEYAMFCTVQIEDQHAIADIKRMESLHKSKQDEASRYNDAIKHSKLQRDENAVKRLKKDFERALKLQKMDKTELQRLYNLQQTLLLKAIENFLRCFAACSDFDHYVPKFCTIWLKHSKQKGLYLVIEKELPAVPSAKFLPLMHQLCSRLSTESGEFQESLHELLTRMLSDHPFHTVYQIFSTIFSGGDSVADNRSEAANALVNRVSQERNVGVDSVRDIIAKLSEQFRAYSDLANFPLNQDAQAGTLISINSASSLRTFRPHGLPKLRLPPPGLTIPVSHDLRYASVLYVQKYDDNCRIAGGINKPKILDSLLSNGNKFRELVNAVLTSLTIGQRWE